MIKILSIKRNYNISLNSFNKYKLISNNINNKKMSSIIHQLKTKARIGLCQMPVGSDKAINIKSASISLLEAVNKAKIIPRINGK